MRRSLRTGLGFGVTSGVITSLGMMVGLYSGTQSVLAMVGGILMVAIADSFSDALGIHVSKEMERDNSTKEVWEATITTFLSKFLIAITFLIPVVLFSIKIAIKVSVVWGLLLLGFFSFYIARSRKVKAWPVIFEHLFIAIVVIILAQYSGYLIRDLLV